MFQVHRAKWNGLPGTREISSAAQNWRSCRGDVAKYQKKYDKHRSMMQQNAVAMDNVCKHEHNRANALLPSQLEFVPEEPVSLKNTAAEMCRRSLSNDRHDL